MSLGSEFDSSLKLFYANTQTRIEKVPLTSSFQWICQLMTMQMFSVSFPRSIESCACKAMHCEKSYEYIKASFETYLCKVLKDKAR